MTHDCKQEENIQIRDNLGRFKNGNIPFFKGKTMPDEVKLKISLAKKGINLLEEHKNKIRIYRIGKKLSIESKLKLSEAKKGSKNCLWRGGLTLINYPIRKSIMTLYEYILWRNQIFERDNYTCQNCNLHSGCGKRVNLEVHHIIPFSKLLKDFLLQYSQFSPIEDKETLVRLATTYMPFWNITNGMTLCKKCHGGKKNG